jgi:acyl-coenzyme A synthetase/AMP-(fatty) acid ligase
MTLLTAPRAKKPQAATTAPHAAPPKPQARRLYRVADHVFLHARRRPGAIAVMRGPTPITYGALAQDLAAIIRTLETLAVPPGAIAAIAHEDLYVQLLLVFGCEALGLVTGSFRPQEGPECHALVEMADIVFTTHPHPRATGQQIELNQAWLAAALANPPSRRPRLVPAHPQDLLFICRSSGSTGAAKRMTITHAAERFRMANQRDPAFGLGLTRQSRYLTFMHFAVGITYRAASNLLRLGGTFMFELAPEPGIPTPSIEKSLRDMRPTHTSLSPFQLRALLASLPPGATPLLPNLTIQGVGAKLPRDLRDAALKNLAGRVEVRYGANETGAIGSVDEAGILHLNPGIEAAVDGAPGEIGPLRLRSPGMTTHYLNDPAATAEMFRHLTNDASAKPWFYPGDLGILIGPGRIQLAGRRNDVLNLGGRKIAATALEAKILAAIPLADVAILQQPQSASNPGPAILVVCAVPTPRINPHHLQSLISPIIDYPFRIRLLAQIPRTPEGKIQRAALQTAIFAAPGSSATVPAAAPSPTNMPAITSDT